MNRPPLPPQHPHNHNAHSPPVNPQQHWENAVRRTDSFSSISAQPQCYPNNNVNHQQRSFIDQAQAAGASPMRRPVPLPPGTNNVQNLPPRNMSSSVFNLNHAGYPQPGFQQQHQQSWGMNPMGQVRKRSEELHQQSLTSIIFVRLIQWRNST
jgi:hypothetical protein